jgi:hypothetical protein
VLVKPLNHGLLTDLVDAADEHLGFVGQGLDISDLSNFDVDAEDIRVDEVAFVAFTVQVLFHIMAYIQVNPSVDVESHHQFADALN